jgi:hypothetical protein
MQTLSELRKRGIEALKKELGAVGMARFLRQEEQGEGDYTKEREELLKNFTVDEVWEQMEKLKKNSK